ILQSHFNALVSVLVVHEVDDVHRVDVNAGEPVHHLVEAVQHIIEIEVVAFNSPASRTHLRARDFVFSSIDRVQKALCKVGSCAEELHLLAYQHWRYTAGYGAIISPGPAHNLVAFKLNRAAVDGDLRGKTSERLGKTR